MTTKTYGLSPAQREAITTDPAIQALIVHARYFTQRHGTEHYNWERGHFKVRLMEAVGWYRAERLDLGKRNDDETARLLRSESAYCYVYDLLLENFA